MNKIQKRAIKSKAEKVWEYEQKIEDARKNAPQYVDALVVELSKYTSKLSLEDMINIDEYILEKYNAESS